MSFLDAYQEYHRAQTDAPDRFGEFCGLATLAASIGNRCWIRHGERRLYPNLWVLLLAPSSAFRKSTSISIAQRVLSGVGATIYPSEFSAEALVKILGNQPSGIFCWYEYRTIASLFKREYAHGIKSLLADLYDASGEYKRALVGREAVIKEPSINILAASNLDWLMESLQDSDEGSGWLARFALVPARAKERVFPLPPHPEPGLKAEALRRLNTAARSHEGEIPMTQEARDEYCGHFVPFDKRAEQAGPWSGSLFRLEATALKLALLYARDRGALVIEAEDISRAWGIVSWLADEAVTLFSVGLSGGRFTVERRKVLEIIEAHPAGISRSEVLRACHLSARKLDEVMRTLFEEQRVEKLAVEKGTKREAIVYAPVRDRLRERKQSKGGNGSIHHDSQDFTVNRSDAELVDEHDSQPAREEQE